MFRCDLDIVPCSSSINVMRSRVGAFSFFVIPERSVTRSESPEVRSANEATRSAMLGKNKS